MIKVAFDISPLKNSHQSRGMGYYVKNLLNHLERIENLNILKFSSNEEIKNVDLIHYPYFELFKNSLPIIKKEPTVVTIGDVTPLVFPQHYPPGLNGSIGLLLQKISLKNTKSIITFSQSSGNDLCKYLGINHKKISPIYLAVSENFKVLENKILLKNIQNRFKLPKLFALYVGGVNWNKNILGLTEACLNANIDLVLVGKNFTQKHDLNHPELKSYKDFLKRFSNNKKVHILSFLKDQDLVAVYNLAMVTLLPSFYEGFGLTILESQACGTPVITSDISSMPEVGGDSVLYVNPYFLDEITRRLNLIKNDKKLNSELINRGFKNIKRFSWAKCAQETANVYKKIYEETYR